MLYMRILLFALSAAGWMILIHKRFCVAPEFVPALYCSGCSSMMFFAGLLNVMPEMAAGITAAGLLGFLWSARAKIHFDRRTWLILVGLGGAMLYFAWLLFGVTFIRTDNFTHWGLAIRELLVLDRMPNFSDPVIIFQAYPMGTAVWGYYVCRVTGLGESSFLFVQMMMELAFLLPVFAWMSKRKWYLAVLPVGFCLYALCANVSVMELQVDSLLPVTAVALFSVGLYYREQTGKAVWCASPLLILLIQMKNSGIFFAAAFLIYFVVLWRKELCTQGRLRNRFLVLDVLLPLGSLLLWNRHVQYVFEAGEESLHAMSAASFAAVVSDKSAEDIRQITAMLWREATSVKNETFCLMVILTVFIAIAMVCSHRKDWKEWTALLCVDWVFYWAYVLGLLATYIFSMEREEAIYLTAYSRYAQSYGIFVCGFTVIQIMRHFEMEKGSLQRAAAVLCLVAAALPFWNPWDLSFRYGKNWGHLTRRNNDATVLETVRQHKSEYGDMDPYMSYYVYFDSETEPMTRNYLVHLLRYEFRSDKVVVAEDFSACQENIRNLNADYLYIWTADETSEKFLAENGLLGDGIRPGRIINLMKLQ